MTCLFKRVAQPMMSSARCHAALRPPCNLCHRLPRSAAFYVREEIGGGRRSLAREAALAAAAAVCLGFGAVFLLLWCGVFLG